MATAEFSPGVPSDLSERFLPEESPSFEVLREAGCVRLWRSTTLPRSVEGLSLPGKVHYHVTTGNEADFLLMGNFDRAVAIFDGVVAQQHSQVRS